MKKRFADEQVVRIPREAESKQASIRGVCKRHNITEQNFFRWRKEGCCAASAILHSANFDACKRSQRLNVKDHGDAVGWRRLPVTRIDR